MTALDTHGLASRIKEQRKLCKLTQEQTAERLDITYSSYAKIENAYQTPSLQTLAAIAQVLDVSLDYLVFGTEK